MDADVRLVRLEYLVDLLESGKALPRRQEAEKERTNTGASALVAASELRQVDVNPETFHTSIMISDPVPRRLTVRFVSISHVWESMQHPDPWRLGFGILGQAFPKWEYPLIDPFPDGTVPPSSDFSCSPSSTSTAFASQIQWCGYSLTFSPCTSTTETRIRTEFSSWGFIGCTCSTPTRRWKSTGSRPSLPKSLGMTARRGRDQASRFTGRRKRRSWTSLSTGWI